MIANKSKRSVSYLSNSSTMVLIAYTFICFVLITTIQGLIFYGNLFAIINKILENPIFILMYIPTVVLSLLIANYLRNNQCKNIKKVEVTVIDNYYYDKDLKLWFMIFAGKIPANFYNIDFYKLANLVPFSLEIFPSLDYLRIYLFSKTKKILRTHIDESEPIISLLFPGIKQMEHRSFIEETTSTEIHKMGNNYFLKKENVFYQLSINENIDSLKEKDIYKLAIVYDENNRKNNEIKNKDFRCGKLECQVQAICYSFEKDIYSFYGKFYRHLSDTSINVRFLSIKPVIVNYFVKKAGKIDFTTSLSYIKLLSGNTSFLKDSEVHKNNNGFSSVRLENEVSDNIDLKLIDKNPICNELCDIPTFYSLTPEKRMLRCEEIRTISRKLCQNKSFLHIINKLLSEDDNEIKKSVIKNLIDQISFRQLSCTLATLYMDKSFNFNRNDFDQVLFLLMEMKLIYDHNVSQPADSEKISDKIIVK